MSAELFLKYAAGFVLLSAIFALVVIGKTSAETFVSADLMALTGLGILHANSLPSPKDIVEKVVPPKVTVQPEEKKDAVATSSS